MPPMGGSGASLDAAMTYSRVVFAGAILVWLFNSLANVIRGTGNMAFPALVTCVGVVVLIPLSPCLIFGLGPFPKARHRRRRCRGAPLLCGRRRGARGLSALRPQRRPPDASRHPAALGAVRRHSSRRRGRGADHGADQSDDRHRHRPRRRVRSRRHRRLRHRFAPRISAHSAGVRSRRTARRHGRHQYRRRPPRSRAPRRLDRRRHCRGALRNHRPQLPPPCRAPGCRCSAPTRP